MSEVPFETDMPDPYAGMTTNERLFAAGLLSAWDEALSARDRAKMIQVLRAVDFSATDAEEIVDTVLASPELYGSAGN
jgi:hypothetical protein